NAWKELCLSKTEVREKDKNFWAYETLDHLCEEEPFECLKIIVKICETTDNEEILSNVAAGPLEDLLVRHGKTVIAEVEKWAIQNRKYKRVLASVWKNEIDDAVWM